MTQKKSIPNGVLWITDPWDTLDHPNDTSLRLIEESVKLKIPTFWCDLTTIRLVDQKVLVTAFEIKSVAAHRAIDSFTFGLAQAVSPSRFRTVHYRTDPPVDSHYLHPLQLIASNVQGTRTRLINPPEILFQFSEKSGAGLPKSWVPDSFTGTSSELLAAFGRKIGKTVAKPPHLAQSKGVELLEWQTPEQESRSLGILKEMTQDFSTPVVLQRFLDTVYKGEKRLWYVHGKLIATVLKRPLQGDFRVHIDLGSEIVSTKLTGTEKRRATELGAFLKKKGIELAAVDLIGGKISDLNFTSPGLIVQMEKVTGINLARTIIQALK